MNTKPFQNKFSSQKERDQKDFPMRAFYALFEFFPIEECHQLLWKLLKLSMYTKDDALEAEERLLLMDYYQSLSDVLDGAYMIHEATAPDSMVQYNAEQKNKSQQSLH